MGRAMFASSLVTPSDPLARLVDADVDTSRVVLHVGGLAAAYLRLVKKRAITFRGHIWFRDEAVRGDRALVVHELVHVGQYRRMGTPRFLFHYLRDLARARFRYSHDLPLEAPAYARQAEATALLENPPSP